MDSFPTLRVCVTTYPIHERHTQSTTTKYVKYLLWRQCFHRLQLIVGLENDRSLKWARYKIMFFVLRCLVRIDSARHASNAQVRVRTLLLCAIFVLFELESVVELVIRKIFIHEIGNLDSPQSIRETLAVQWRIYAMLWIFLTVSNI